MLDRSSRFRRSSYRGEGYHCSPVAPKCTRGWEEIEGSLGAPGLIRGRLGTKLTRSSKGGGGGRHLGDAGAHQWLRVGRQPEGARAHLG